MIHGIDIFREHFSDYHGQYVLIGGSACDLVFSNNQQTFRATKDLDIVLIAEALTPDFGRKFWSFIHAGGYEIKQRSDGSPIFYRFQKPTAKQYPYMIELFSRNANILQPTSDTLGITRISVGEALWSLSAILLNDAYYRLIKEGAVQIEGVSVLSEAYLILFKAKAWLDLTQRKRDGEEIDSHNIRKHRNDVVRLTLLLTPDQRISLEDGIKEDLYKFYEALQVDPIDFRGLGLRGIEQSDVMERLKTLFEL